jgi:hypothetical protein
MVRKNFTHKILAPRGDCVVVPDDPLPVTHKWCHQCRRWKDYDDFNRNRTRVDGRCTECRECENANKRRRSAVLSK